MAFGGLKMKKSIPVIILTFLLIMFTSCGTSETGKSYHGMNKETSLKDVELPDKLSIEFETDDIRNIEEAKTYLADYMEFDKQKLVNSFMKNSITEEKILAEGPQVISSSGNVTEFLSIYDGGKSFGVETGMEGGFAYSKTVDDLWIKKWDTVASSSFLAPGFNEQYRLNSDYGSQIDLDFLPYEDALADIRKILKMAGIPAFDIDETYSLDLETILSHYRLYLENNMNEEERKLTWTKDDECYIFSLRQLVDNIPIVNKTWQMPDGTKASVWGNPMPAASIHLVYDKTGICDIEAYNILRITDEKEKNKLISVYEALNTLIHDYSLTILEDEISIDSAELCYLIIPKDNMAELVPGWVFRSAKTEKTDGGNYIQYKYDVVNAITGELYQDRW